MLMPNPVDTEEVGRSGRSLLASAGWMTGSNLIAQTFAYGSLLLLARWLSPASFGTVAVATAIVGIGVLFVDRGTWGSVIVEREITRFELGRAFRRCLATAVFLAVIMAGASELVVKHFAAGGHSGALAAIALCLPVHAIAVVPTALLQRSMQFRRLAAVNGISNIVSALTGVALASWGAGVWALVARQLVLFGLIAALSTALCLSALRSIPSGSAMTERVRSGARSERWFFWFSVTNAANGSADKLVVGLFGGASLVGMYSIANTIAMAPWTQFSSQAGQVLFAAAASQTGGVSRRTEQSTRLMSLLMLPMLPFALLIAPAVLPAVLGAGWTPVVPVFEVLLVVGIGNAIVNCIAETLTGIGYMRFRARIMFAQLAANLLALSVLVPVGGIRGAAVAQLLVFVPYAAVYFTSGARRVGSRPGALLRGMRPALVAMAWQVAASSTVLFALILAGATDGVASCSAAIVGLAAAAPMAVRALGRTGAS